MDEGQSRQQAFPTTQWSLILRVTRGDPLEQQKALEEICTLYWPPVYAFIRSRGHPPHDAEDLTQGFFADLLKRNDFAKADAALGRLRTYLLAAVQNLLASEFRRGRAQKRGGGAVILSLDVEKAEADYWIPEPTDAQTPERVFERQWALTVMEQVIVRLEEHYRDKGQADLFAALKPCLMRDDEACLQAELAARLGLSESALRVKLHRLRKRYGDVLREVVGATLRPEESVADEIRQLMNAFQ